jgi:succinate dehydrogenase hydrophobic anchor subunit
MNELIAAEEPQYSPVSAATASNPASTSTIFAGEPISVAEKSVYVLLFALLVAIRIPKILDGRFWAEEGTIFFRHAWQVPWEQAILWSYGGYLNISANLAGILAAHLVPLEKACYVTSLFGLIVQTFPVILLCSSDLKWLQDRKTLICALLLIATPPLSQEIWLSCIGSQVHLTLCVALILALPTRTGLSGWFQKLLLLVGPLSGPGSASLVPLFALRAWIDKSRQRFIQALILGTAAVIQFAFFFHPNERATLSATPTTVLGIDPLLLLNVFFVKHMLAPCMGIIQTTEITKDWGNGYAKGISVSPQTAFLAAAILTFSAYSLWRSKRAEPKWFFFSGALLWMVGNFGALGVRAALLNTTECERYVFAPQMLFELAILYFAHVSKGWKKTLFSGITIWLLVIGLHEYFWTSPFYCEGPPWRQEVHKWRENPDYLLNIWPKGWTVQLDRK